RASPEGLRAFHRSDSGRGLPGWVRRTNANPLESRCPRKDESLSPPCEAHKGGDQETWLATVCHARGARLSACASTGTRLPSSIEEGNAGPRAQRGWLLT